MIDDVNALHGATETIVYKYIKNIENQGFFNKQVKILCSNETDH